MDWTDAKMPRTDDELLRTNSWDPAIAFAAAKPEPEAPAETSPEELAESARVVARDKKIVDMRAELEELEAAAKAGDVCVSCDSPDLRGFKSQLLDRDSALSAAKNLPEFLEGLPKCELHIHAEGTLTAATAHRIATRNGIENLEEFDPSVGTEKRREFVGLVPFLTEYGKCSSVMRKEEDFYDLMHEYLVRAAENGVKRAEIFFDPQTHCFTDVSGVTAMGKPEFDSEGVGVPILPFETVINGLFRALEEGRRDLGVDGHLILCFLRDRSIAEALQVLEAALPHKEKIIAVGLDNAEYGFRPGRFKAVYDKARAAGLHCVAHAGEEGDASYVTEALDELKIERVDHGVRCLEDPALVERLRASQTPLTVCPCSNHRLQVFPRFFCGENAVRQMMNKGLKVKLQGPAACRVHFAVDSSCLTRFFFLKWHCHCHGNSIWVFSHVFS